MFFRKKKINGKEYYYLVKSVREGGSVTQKFVQYIGPELPEKNELEKIKAKAKESD